MAYIDTDLVASHHHDNTPYPPISHTSEVSRSRRPIRVLRIVTRMNVGGPAQQIANLSSGLSTLGYESRLLCGSAEPGEAEYLSLHDVDLPISVIPRLRRSLNLPDDALAYKAIYTSIRDMKPDIVHTHTAKAGFLGRLAAVQANVPTIIHTFHGHLLRGYFGPSGSYLLIRTERWLARRTSLLCSVGMNVSRELVAAGIGTQEQYRVVPPGILPPPRIRHSHSRRALNLPEDVPVIAYVGRLTNVKRPDRLLAVADLVIRQRPDTHFVIAGGGDLLQQTRSASGHLSKQIHYLGWTSNLGAVYGAADATVLVSDNEGMPVSLIESSMVGTPAVTTNVGSAAEVVLHEETGLVVPTDATRIAEALLRLIRDDGLRKRLGQAAHRYANKAFSANRLVDTTAQIYEEACGQTRDHSEH